MGLESLQGAGEGRRRNFYGEEEDTDKFHCVQRDHGIIVSQTSHGAATWHLRPPYEGVQHGRGSIEHLCGVLPQSAAVGEMPGARLTGGST